METLDGYNFLIINQQINLLDIVVVQRNKKKITYFENRTKNRLMEGG